MDRGMDRPISAVLQDIIANIQDIVRSELHLAKAEVKEEVEKAGKAARLGVLGGVLGFFSFGLLLLSAVYGLALVIPAWLAALCIAFVLGLAASIMISQSKKSLRLVHPKPEKTIASIRETLHG